MNDNGNMGPYLLVTEMDVYERMRRHLWRKWFWAGWKSLERETE